MKRENYRANIQWDADREKVIAVPDPHGLLVIVGIPPTEDSKPKEDDGQTENA